MICFICHVNTPTLPSLISHYKIIHLLGPHSSYTCKENNCLQSFQTLSSFKKHVLVKHKFENNIDETVAPNEFTIINDSNTFDVEIECSDNNIIPDIPSIINASEISNKNVFDVNKSIEQLHLFAVQFSLSLHSNNNFCRSDITNIQNDIEKKIIKPITSLLEGIIKSEITDHLILSKFSKVVSAISDSFKLCKTEYLLNKCFTTNDLLTDTCKQFTINNEVNLVSHNGQTVFDEISTKAILMPLKFQFKKYFELNNNLNLAIKHYNYLINLPVLDDNCPITNFIQGSLWKKKIIPHQNKIVMPFFYVY